VSASAAVSASTAMLGLRRRSRQRHRRDKRNRGESLGHGHDVLIIRNCPANARSQFLAGSARSTRMVKERRHLHGTPPYDELHD
jgi:hypothetical protein